MSFIEIICMVFGLVLSYLIGSLTPSIWIGKLFYNVDIRTKGSKNAGATNTIRVLGLKAGIIVFIIDAFKGWLAIYIARLFVEPFWVDYGLDIYCIIAAACAILGHVFPIYENFKGGKGVATMLGVLISMYSHIFVLVLLVFIIVFIIWHYISLGSIVAATAFPFIYYFYSTYVLFDFEWVLFIFSCAVSIFILITHRNNIKRLARHEESKFRFKKTEK